MEIFSIGDIHGQAHLLDACLTEIARLPRIPGIERIVLFLGDLVDRGPDSLGAVRLALDAPARCLADRAVLLPGNHELMLIDVLDGDHPQLWIGNGGSTVLSEIDHGWRGRHVDDSRELLRDALPDTFEQTIRDAPSHMRFGDLLFVHAGLDPYEKDAIHLERRRPVSDQHWAWIRNEFLTWQGGWDIDPETGVRMTGPTVVVHGHTPALRSDLSGDPRDLEPLEGIDTHRAVCLDAGAAYRPRIGWARFWRDGEASFMQIHATYTAEPTGGWLP